ncbi:two-component system response regulator [Rhodoferax koreense]|uniref:Two-component system response regulator n=1 Tax=Rhodoferax koreensis TaxID=1842727 RepID=A0A1P8K3H5_9BURK|nr:response regulator [Rhodoferax koreense]APW40563.1 two-component system response regulator [Rhodoferax koreense]
MRARILVIEDNAANLELARYLLCAAGHEVLAATDGHAGLLLAQQQHPDLVISDLQMPGLDGYALLSALQQDPGCQHIPVLALTASSMPGDRETVIRAGFRAYMSKPIEPEMFVGEIESLLEPAKPRAPPRAS